MFQPQCVVNITSTGQNVSFTFVEGWPKRWNGGLWTDAFFGGFAVFSVSFMEVCVWFVLKHQGLANFDFAGRTPALHLCRVVQNKLPMKEHLIHEDRSCRP